MKHLLPASRYLHKDVSVKERRPHHRVPTDELDPFGSNVLNEALLPGYERGLNTHSDNVAAGETNPVADFLLAYPSQAQVGIGGGAENAHINWAHFYIEDGWKPAPNLKLDFGLRYESARIFPPGPIKTSNIDLEAPGGPAFVVSGNPANGRRPLLRSSGAPFTVNLSSAAGQDVARIGLVGGNNLERPDLVSNPNAVLGRLPGGLTSRPFRFPLRTRSGQRGGISSWVPGFPISICHCRKKKHSTNARASSFDSMFTTR